MASTIKVDNVQNQPGTNIIDKCGTTITLGQSGDTVSLASGASQTGFGRTGTVDWITTPKVTGDSPVTAVTGKGYFLNTTAGTITINLPAGAAGSIVSMADYAGTWNSNNVTVSPNGAEKIGGSANDATLSVEGQSVTFVYVDGTQGWVNTMDSTSNVRGETFVAATVSGACNTLATAPCCANTKIATFLGPGTFCVSSVSTCAANNLVSYMIVAGGGGGSGGGCASTTNGGGGGGAGGYREVESPVTPYTSSPLDGYPNAPNRITVTASPYPIIVGAGSPAATGSSNPRTGVTGNVSTFDSITSAGGGGGGCGTNTSPTQGIGTAGGSGGGAGWKAAPGGTPGAGNTPPTTPPQGQSGGDNTGAGGGGGGGGAGAAGSASPGAPTADGGAGGNGVSSSISSAAVLRAGGGGAGNWANANSAAAGTGGGGAGGANSPGGNATINTGGGGGGAGAMPGCCTTGGQGGSGVVIIRYKFQ